MTSKSAIASFKPWAPRTPRHIRDLTRPLRLYFRRKRMRPFVIAMMAAGCFIPHSPVGAVI
jgi:hypothetical protein